MTTNVGARPELRHAYQNHHLDGPRWLRFAQRPGDIVISTSYKAGTTLMQTIVANLLFPDGELPLPANDLAPWIDMRLRPYEEMEAELDKRYGKDADLALVTLIEWLDANDADGEGPSVQACLAFLRGLGDLHQWRSRQLADDHEVMLVQLAKEDFYVPADQIELWRQAMRGKGEVKTYATSHGMEAPQGLADREEFLHRTLGIGSGK